MVFRNGYRKVFSFLFREVLESPKWIRLSVVLNAVHVMLVDFTIENMKHNPPKSH